MGLVNLRPPTTVFLQATSDIKRKVNARPHRRSRALAVAHAPSPAHARAPALSVFFAQRWHTFYNYRFMYTLILQLQFYVHKVLTRLFN
jgi:hypothetical protein